MLILLRTNVAASQPKSSVILNLPGSSGLHTPLSSKLVNRFGEWWMKVSEKQAEKWHREFGTKFLVEER